MKIHVSAQCPAFMLNLITNNAYGTHLDSVFVVFVNILNPVPGEFPETGHDRLLPNSYL